MIWLLGYLVIGVVVAVLRVPLVIWLVRKYGAGKNRDLGPIWFFDGVLFWPAHLALNAWAVGTIAATSFSSWRAKRRLGVEP